MASSLSSSLASGPLLIGIVAAAAALNLSVMDLGAEEAPTSEVAVASTSSAPEVRQVVVDVPVPMTDVAAQAPLSQAAAPRPVPAAQPQPQPTAPPTPPTAPVTTTPPTVAPAPSAPPTTAPPATAATPSTPPTTATATTQANNTEYLMYTFDGVAAIVVAFHDGEALEFWSATPEPGWAFMVEKNEPDKVELKFRRVSGGEGEAKFELINDDGDLEVKKER